ncbi:unnamed protein product [Vitrella brassicaformis CCMP3155]|uniref:TLDc domain-containing protein n=1 Tax=Vitrella brassicaformis (strain CCMP3155) TaxID=1169540 RepID=A0A0G4FNU0_VITBC|nr:unnamed protein product [Vitrella brassicaformis CCMP3155]|eukprot:CEM15852.1 unnamed protein product [Vitrella brassicaformis CCMP3155]
MERTATQMAAWLAQCRKIIDELERRQKAMQPFLHAIHPFLRHKEDKDDDTKLLTVHIAGRRVSVLPRTLKCCPSGHPLLELFATEPPARHLPFKYIQKIVDFARRKAVMGANVLVMPPTVKPREVTVFQGEMEKYGSKPSEVYCNDGGGEMGFDGLDLVIKLETEWTRVLEMIKEEIREELKANQEDLSSLPPMLFRSTLLYKSSCDGTAYTTLLDSTKGKEGLLFLFRHGDTHRFGAFVMGGLQEPEDPTKENYYDTGIFFLSLKGAYARPTKIPLDDPAQCVCMGGRQGAANNADDEPAAKMFLGDGRLWLGWGIGDPQGPSKDITQCHTWLDRDDLPQGYQGIWKDGVGSLAASDFFAADDIEIWNICHNWPRRTST